MQPTALVTGANGFTGSRFCLYLARKGVQTRGLYYTPDGGEPDFGHDCLELVAGDIRDRACVKKIVAGVDVVYHIAALYRPTNVPKKDFWDVNVEGTRYMLEAAAEAGVKRFVHCSTIGVHGNVKNPPAAEDAPIQPDDYYQYTKLKGEELARDHGRQLGLEVSIVRPAAIYGAGERRFLKLAQLIKRRRFVLFGNGEVKYHFIHIDDLSDAFVLCATKEEAVGQTYIIADDHAVTLNCITEVIAKTLAVSPPKLHLPYGLLYTASALCEAICAPLRISPPLHRRRAAWFRSTRSFDIGKARRQLGFEPKVAAEEGLARMVESYIEAGWIPGAQCATDSAQREKTPC